jgi:gluconate 2-dehydrogenase gamma chain
MGAVYPTQTKSAITYSGGTIKPGQQAGTAYQYAFNPREFWRRGLVSLETYCTSAKGGKFESLDSTTQTTVLQEMFDNKSDNTALQTAFQGPNAAEFFNEIHDMVTAGFWADPIYGGNQGMVGWKLIAFNGNYWGDDIGLGPSKLMVASTPTRLPPKSLGQLQKEGGGI